MCRASPPARWAPSSTRSVRAAGPRARSAGWVAGSTSAWARSWAAPKYVNMVVMAAAGVNTEAQREMLGLKVGASEAEPFWTEFRRSLNRRGLRGVKLVISEPRGHQGHRILGARRHLAALPSALHEERLGTRRQDAGKTQARRSGAGSRLPSEPSSFQTRPTRRARGGDPQPISSEASFQNSERSWTRPRRRARAHELPTDALDPDRQHQPARTAERGDQAAHERRGHLLAASITRLAGAVMLFPTRLPSVAH